MNEKDASAQTPDTARVGTDDRPLRTSDAEAPTELRCPSCNGNDTDAPCAYPGETMRGCLRDMRLDDENKDVARWRWVFQRAGWEWDNEGGRGFWTARIPDQAGASPYDFELAVDAAMRADQT